MTCDGIFQSRASRGQRKAQRHCDLPQSYSQNRRIYFASRRRKAIFAAKVVTLTLAAHYPVAFYSATISGGFHAASRGPYQLFGESLPPAKPTRRYTERDMPWLTQLMVPLESNLPSKRIAHGVEANTRRR